MCARCTQKDSEFQAAMTTLHEKGNRYYGEVLNLRAEVKMLRDWAKLLNLSPPPPPPPPATIPPQNEPTSGMIDSNYEYCTQGEREEEKQQKCADDGKNGDEANLMDVIKTEDVSETFVDSVEIGEPIKREQRFKCICQPLKSLNFVRIFFSDEAVDTGKTPEANTTTTETSQTLPIKCKYDFNIFTVV